MRAYFVYNNLKVNTFFLPHDGPIPGFELLAWDSEAFTIGTLLDIGDDAGFTPLGKTRVHGQIWVAHNTDCIKELERFSGIESGFTEIVRVPVSIFPDSQMEALTFRLTNIPKEYKIVDDGKWLIKRV